MPTLLSANIQLQGFDSLGDLAALSHPVRPKADGQEAFIDIIVGLRQVEVHADGPLEGWREVTDAETRFEIDPDTSGAQLASALGDQVVVDAIGRVISPPAVKRPKNKSEASLLTGNESFNQAVTSLIDALSRHMSVLRPRPVVLTEPESGPEQAGFSW